MTRRETLKALLADIVAAPVAAAPILNLPTDPNNPPGPDWYWCEKCARWHQKSYFREKDRFISSPADGYLDFDMSVGFSFNTDVGEGN